MSDILEDINKIYENYFSRYTVGCFLKGDIVTFDDGFEKDECFLNMPPEIREKLISMVEAQRSGDAVISVEDVELPPFLKSQSNPANISIGYCMGGNRIFDTITIPGILCKYMRAINDDINLPNTVPQNMVRDYTKEFEGTVELEN